MLSCSGVKISKSMISSKPSSYVIRERSRSPVMRSPTDATPVGNVEMQNIIGQFRGQQRGIVIIAGHYDTARLPGVAFIGANDGGSSAAELLELARVLRKRTHSLTYWLVFFDGEEAIEHWSATDSLYGSRHFVETLRASGKLSEVRAVLLLDMVAGGSPQFQPEGL